MTWNWQHPGWPKFHYDAAALQPFEDRFLLGAGRLSGLWAHLAADDLQHIKVDLLSAEAMTTSAIEGEYLDRASVQSSIKRAFGMKAPPRGGAAERGIAALMVTCFEQFDTALDHQTLFDWHRLLCQGRNDLNRVGAYRDHADPMQIVSGSYQKLTVHFEAPASKDVPREMDRFLIWFTDRAGGLPLLARSAQAHLYFVTIHPFEDGNGRIGRAVAEKALAQGLGQPSLLSLSYMIEQRRKGYYAALEASNKGPDVTDWVLWFAKAVLAAQDHSQRLFEHLIAKARMMERLQGQINTRQQKALLRLFEAGPEGFTGGLSARNYMTITGTSAATARRDLGGLVDLGVLTRSGQFKGTRYWLAVERDRAKGGMK